MLGTSYMTVSKYSDIVLFPVLQPYIPIFFFDLLGNVFALYNNVCLDLI